MKGPSRQTKKRTHLDHVEYRPSHHLHHWAHIPIRWRQEALPPKLACHNLRQAREGDRAKGYYFDAAAPVLSFPRRSSSPGLVMKLIYLLFLFFSFSLLPLH